MPKIIKHKGIVVGTGKTGEQSRYVDILTSKDEIVHCVARNAAKSKKRFVGALEPFTSGVFHVKESIKYRPTLEGVDHALSRFSLSRDIHCMYMASYCCQWTKKLARDDVGDGQWFRFLCHFLDILCTTDFSPAILFWFELAILQMSGHMDSLDDCPLCEGPLNDGSALYFDYRDGFFGHRDHDHMISGEDVEFSVFKIIKALLSSLPDRVHRIKLSRSQTSDIERLTSRLLKIHLSSIPRAREMLIVG